MSCSRRSTTRSCCLGKSDGSRRITEVPKLFGLNVSQAHQYGSLVGRALVEDGEALRLESRRGLRAPEIRIKGCGFGIARFCGECDRIHDRRVRVIGELADDRYVLIGGGIGLIDD